MRYVIIGGGPAATNAMETIRQYDSGDEPIVLISDEPAHSRMAIPYWLNGKISQEHCLTQNDATYEKLNVDPRIGARAQKLDLEQRQVSLEDGSSVPFDRLFLATGSTPNNPPIEGSDLPGVTTLWSLADVAGALEYTTGIENPRVLFVGAGFVGMIVLGAVFHRGWKIVVVEQENRILPRMLDQGASTVAASWLAKRGVEVCTSASVQRIEPGAGTEKTVTLSDGSSRTVDLVIMATGVRPNLQLVQETQIATDEGILVDHQMQTNIEGIYAGGDVAQGPAMYESEPVIHAIQPTAVDHGRVAGANMAGESIEYPGSLGMNVVDVCGLQCISYGSWLESADDDVVIDNQRDHVYRRLIFRGEQLVGALFAGAANEAGMLNDVGMVKGILQTQIPLGNWKAHLQANPLDVRRPYIGLAVAQQLAKTTLLGRPSVARSYRLQDAQPKSTNTPAHRTLIDAAQQK